LRCQYAVWGGKGSFKPVRGVAVSADDELTSKLQRLTPLLGAVYIELLWSFSKINLFSKGFSMGMMSEFKEFAVKGNVMDLAVGVIIGGAFGKIVDSIVGDLIMPVIGKITGGLDFSNMFIGLNNQAAGLTLVEAKKAGAVFAYGSFITAVIQFTILAFIIFLMVKQMNKLKSAVPPPATPEDVVLLREIRDSLKK
jgi:large conductance mechanosensitive channel